MKRKKSGKGRYVPLTEKQLEKLVRKALEPIPRGKNSPLQLQDLDIGELFVVFGSPDMRGRLEDKSVGSARVTFFDDKGRVIEKQNIALGTNVTRRKRLKGVRASKPRAEKEDKSARDKKPTKTRKQVKGKKVGGPTKKRSAAKKGK